MIKIPDRRIGVTFQILPVWKRKVDKLYAMLCIEGMQVTKGAVIEMAIFALEEKLRNDTAERIRKEKEKKQDKTIEQE